jgi:hypothetical protein
MDIGKYGVTFFVVVAVVALLAATPVLSRVLVYPRTEFFTEMYILGSNHTAEGYPFNVSSGQTYSIYLGIGNHVGFCAYYLVVVKFRNESQSQPSNFGPIENRTPSNLQSLFNITAFVADESVWERALTFSFNYDVDSAQTLVTFQNMTFNDVVLNLNGYTTTWNSSRSIYSGNLFFELWLYNPASSFDYNKRYVDLKLNMTI